MTFLPENGAVSYMRDEEHFHLFESFYDLRNSIDGWTDGTVLYFGERGPLHKFDL